MQYELIRKTILKRLVLFLALSILSLNAANMVLEEFINRYSDGGRLEISTKIAQDSNGSGSVYLNKIAYLRDEMRGCDVSYTAEKNGILQNGNEFREAGLVMTDGLYAGFSGLDIFKGSFFSQDSCNKGRNLAVISESTAKELYSSYDIIGSEILISGIKYRICGIYRERHTLFTYLGDDGKNRIYVPLQSMDNGREQPLGTIYIAGETVEKDEFRIHNLEETLSQKLGIFPSDVRITDYYGTQLTLAGLQAFFVFCVGLYILWVVFVGILKVVKSISELIKKNRESNYLMGALAACKYDILKAAGIVLLEIGLAAAAFTAIKFTPYIPSTIIPQDNIFDFGFYAQKLKLAIQGSNQSVYFAPSALAGASSAALWIEFLLLAVFVTAFISALAQLKLMRMAEISLLDITVPFIISIVIGMVLSLLFALVTGLVVAIAVKQAAVVLAVVIIYGLRGSRLNNVFLLQSSV